jgi:formate-dependent nitrite reductase membrane component NrfD
LGRTGYFIAPPIVALGTLLLLFDLGQGIRKPLLLTGLLHNLSSVMTWGVYILSLFLLAGFLKAFLVFRRKPVPAVLTWAGAVFALATGTYTGLLLSVIAAIPLWNTAVLPVLFVVSALSTGLSAASLVSRVSLRTGEGRFRRGGEDKTHLFLIVAELLFAAIFFCIMFSGTKGPAGVAAAASIVSGRFAPVFWGCFTGLGLLFPLAVFGIHCFPFRNPPAVLAKTGFASLTVFADIAVLIGGFTLRALIILAVVPVWDGFTIF